MMALFFFFILTAKSERMLIYNEIEFMFALALQRR